MDLKGKTALVTGSTSGIGLAVAHSLAKLGCRIILTGLEEEMNATMEEFKRLYGIEVDYFGADMLKMDQLEALVRHVFDRHPSGIDILINNAGLFHMGPIDGYPDENWDIMVGIHMTAPFHLTKRFLPSMKRKGWGRIVNMSSQMGLVSYPGKAVYSAVKSGLIGLTKGVALEVAECGVTCNAVCPTFAKTELLDSEIETKAKKDGTTFEEAMYDEMSDVPTRKPVTPPQIADLVVFLVTSEASSQMTGAQYLIDGGYTSH